MVDAKGARAWLLETDRINGRAANTTANPEGDPVVLSSDEELKTMCHNGKCTWKMKAKYDNIYHEITGHSESSDEE